MGTIIRTRRDTEANWASNNPVIPDGQLCVDITNNTVRIGNGTSNYLDLPLVGGSTGPTTLVGLTDTPVALGTAGQVLKVNGAGNALEFVDESSGDNLGSYEKAQMLLLSPDVWTQKTNGPSARHGSSAIYYNDGTNNLMVIFGGTNNGSIRYNDTWEYNLDTDTWTQKASGASDRHEHSAIYYNDGINDLMIIYGGSPNTNEGDGGDLGDIWEYNLGTDTWTQRTINGTPPSVRSSHSAIYYNDGTNNLMVVHGGTSPTYLIDSDTWEYNLDTDTWVQKASDTIGKYAHTAIYYNNGTNNLMVVHGGLTPGVTDVVKEYNLDTNTWTQKTSGATPRQSATAIYYNDGTYDLMDIIFGGVSYSVAMNDTWTYNLTTDTWFKREDDDNSKSYGQKYKHTCITYKVGAVRKAVIFDGVGPYNGYSHYLFEVELKDITTIYGLSSDKVLNKTNKPGNSLTEVINNLTSSALIEDNSNNTPAYMSLYRHENPDNYGPIGEGAIDLSTSDGSSTTRGATDYYCVAFGNNTTASGEDSFASCYETTASGFASFTSGSHTIASGDYTMATGNNNTASGDYSVAFGNYTLASGDYTMATGNNNTASGNYSVAFGNYTKALNSGEIAYGISINSSHGTLISNSIKTTDATQRILTTITAGGVATLEYFQYTLTVARDDNSEIWVRHGEFIIKRTTSAITISNHVGTDVVKDTAGWALDLVANDSTATDLDIRITGEGSKNITWGITLKKHIIYL